MVTRLDGTRNADALVAGTTADYLIFGLGGDDTLLGNNGDDRLFGGNGDDTLFLSAGTDLLFGGAGNDTYIFGALSGSAFVITAEEPNQGHDTIIMNTYFFTMVIPENVEEIVLNADVDYLWGSTGNDRIDASSRGNGMFVDAGDGDDLILGTFADDLIYGGSGADAMRGGFGFDTYYVDDAGDSVREVNAPADYDNVVSSVSFVLPKYVEALSLTGPAVSATGNGAANFLAGTGSANMISGLGGTDNLFGGDGDDTLDGGKGDDFLQGGLGRDTLSGGAGNDLFVYLGAAESGAGAATSDLITDFAAGDLIDLSAIDADTARSGFQTFSFVQGAAFSGAAGELRYDPGLSILEADRDGDGTGDFAIDVAAALADISAGLII